METETFEIKRNETLRSLYEDEKKHSIVSYVLLSILFLLRFSLLIRFNWTSTTYEVGTYFFTALLIFWERKRLRDFHMDSIAVIFFIVLKPLETILLAVFNSNLALLIYKPAGIIIWCISIFLGVSLFRSKYKREPVTRKMFLWLCTAFIIGLFLAISNGIALSFQLKAHQMPNIFNFSMIVNILYQAGYAGVSEEPLFRGFLWGYLLKLGWKNIWILLFQTGLFMMAHFYYITSHPVSFFYLVPTVGLVFGLTAWKSKTISTSIIVHGVSNGLGRQIGQFISNLR